MKKLLCILLAAMLVVSAAACQTGSGNEPAASAEPSSQADSSTEEVAEPGEEPAEPSQGGGEGDIRVVWWGSDSRHEITLQAIDLFEAAYPDITVSPEYMGSDSYWDKLATQVAGGTAPDVIQFGGNYPDYVAKDALLELDSYVGNLLDLSVFDQDVLEVGSMNGHLYGICLGTNMLCLVYNKGMLEENGIPLPDSDMTWEELAAYGESIKDQLPDGVFPMTDNSSDQTNYYAYFVRQNGEFLYREEEGSTASVETTLKWINLWEDFRDAGLIPDAETTGSYSEEGPDNSVIVAGKAAMKLIWSNQLVAYQAAMEDELEVIQLPTGANNAINMQPSQYMCVNKASANPDAAVTFINFFVNDPEVGTVLGNDRGISSSSVVREAISAIATPVDQKIYDYYAVASQRTVPQDPNLPNDQEFNNTFKLYCQQVAYGQTSREEGAQLIYDLIQDMLAK